jgi:O-antigen ligase
MVPFLFKLLVFLLPTQLAYHFWPDWSYFFGIRVNYFSPAIYLTDLLILLLVIPWLVKKLRTRKWSVKKTWPFLFILVFALTNSFFAQRFQIALVKWLKIWELVLLGLFIVNEKAFQERSWITVPLCLSLIFFSLIGIGQFIFQRTIGGPLYFLGERHFSSTTPGIALFSFLGREVLRPYSTFGHPNAMAGFFAASLFLVLFSNKKRAVPDFFVKTALFLSILVLLLSFSRGVWLSLVVVVFILLLTRKDNKLLKKIGIFVLMLSFIGSMFLLAIVAKNPSLGQTSKEAVVTRLSLIKASAVVVSERPLVGVGVNNFILKLPGKIPEAYLSWKLQPVHNIFLLVFSETGLIGLLLFFCLLFAALKNLSGRKNRQLAIVIVLILLTGLVDHYWLTLQQNQLLFSLVLGLAFRKK